MSRTYCTIPQSLKQSSIVAVVFSSVDIFVPITLSYRLYTLTTPALAKERSWSARIVNAVSSGTLGALFTILLMILYGTVPIGELFQSHQSRKHSKFARGEPANYLLHTTLGRIYGITLFTNLIVSNRRKNRELNSNALLELPRTTGTTTGTITIFNRHRSHSSTYPTSQSLNSLSFTGKEKALPPTPIATATVVSPHAHMTQVQSPAPDSEYTGIDVSGSLPVEI